MLTPEIRERMGQCAVAVARACNYYGAGTVEFIVDENLDFYFLEMNTRLQVEHPVTELITGVDLVKQMIFVAEGKELPFRQEDLKITGHAIESRVCAEDPRNNFLPDVGTLHTYVRPQGNGVRVDDGIEQGQAIPIFYDAMFAKLVTYGEDRMEAIEKMIRAIDEFQIIGRRDDVAVLQVCDAARGVSFPATSTRASSACTSNRSSSTSSPTRLEAMLAAALAARLFQAKKPVAASSQAVESVTASRWKANRLRN